MIDIYLYSVVKPLWSALSQIPTDKHMHRKKKKVLIPGRTIELIPIELLLGYLINPNKSDWLRLAKAKEHHDDGPRLIFAVFLCFSIIPCSISYITLWACFVLVFLCSYTCEEALHFQIPEQSCTRLLLAYKKTIWYDLPTRWTAPGSCRKIETVPQMASQVLKAPRLARVP